MKVRKFIGLAVVLLLATFITVLYNERFPNYGDTNDDIANIATRRDFMNQLLMGTDVTVFAVREVDTYKIALVKPVDPEDEQFGYLYFKPNASGKCEQRSEVIWCPNNQIQVLKLKTDENYFDIIMYNNPSVILVQRKDPNGVVENRNIAGENGIALWEYVNYGYQYNCVTAEGLKLPQIQ